MLDYKAEFAAAVSDLIAQNMADRSERIAAVHALTEAYVDSIGQRPDPVQLERLADYILREELTDGHRNKTSATEHPFLSETQLARRTDGVHQRKYESNTGEVRLSGAKYTATDGRAYNVPRRRERTKNENMLLDETVKSRNKLRREAYESFVKPSPVVTYTLTHEEMEARGWR